MDIYTVSFFGHRQIENVSTVERQVEIIIQQLLCANDYVEFLVGRNGEFDQFVSAVIRRVKKTFRDDNSCHTLVLPYHTAEYRENAETFYAYYDQVDIVDTTNVHFKAAIQQRNRQMVDRSNIVVCYIERSYGGTFQTYQYAVKKGTPIHIIGETLC